MRDRLGRRNAIRGHGQPGWLSESLILLLFVVLTGVAAWNVVTDLGGVVAGQDSDVPINLWADWWTAKALTDNGLSFWQTPFLFYPFNQPDGVNLSFHSFSHLNSLISLGLSTVIDTIPAYNIVILLNYVLSGFAMYGLAFYLTGSRTAGVLAGIVFTFNSHNQYQSAHPVLLSIWCLPWATRSYWRAHSERDRRQAVYAGLFAALSAATSAILYMLMAIWLALLTVAFWWRDRRLTWRMPSITVAIAGAGALPLLWPLLQTALLDRDTSFFINPADTLYIADIAAPLIPHWYLWLVRGLYVGLVPLLLIVIARYRLRQALLWYLLATSAYLFSIGPYPILLGQRLDFTLPWSLIAVPLLRNPYRLNILLSLGLAMLVAQGWLVLVEHNLKTKAARLMGALLLGALVYVEYTAPLFPATVLPVSPFYTTQLPLMPEDGVIVDIPISRSLGKRYMYYQTFHERPIVGGAISRRPDEVMDYIRGNPLLRAGATDLGPAPLPADASASLRSLAGDGIAYVVLHKGPLGPSLASWREAMPWHPFYEDDLIVAYGTVPDASVGFSEPVHE